jgi:hypothetical protein
MGGKVGLRFSPLPTGGRRFVRHGQGQRSGCMRRDEDVVEEMGVNKA